MNDCPDCIIFDINESVPLEIAIPIYGYVFPIVCGITTVTNSCIIVVLSKVYLRTPTNFILTSMAFMDLLTGTNIRQQNARLLSGLSSLPFFVYYYIFEGYKVDQNEGLSSFWCRVYPILTKILPKIFHTSAVWLAVFLAIQRFFYVCLPRSVQQLCTPKIVKITIVSIFFFAILCELPDIVGKRMRQVQFETRSYCVIEYSSLIADYKQLFYTCQYWTRAVFIHILPCFLLTVSKTLLENSFWQLALVITPIDLKVFTFKLSHAIRKTEVRKRSWATNSIGEQSSDGRRRVRKSKNSGSPVFGLESSPPSSSSALESKPPPSICGRTTHHATTRMLFVICCVFLIIETPAALIYIAHYVIQRYDPTVSQSTYRMLNGALIVR
ncbi:G-PROTEIN-RECEP-F1-2 domain-containing protein [Aphelenchoides besseyi]|nr:G-PROTEIN-RECEP-F1-2 domain-containing protein [Aphelenchoides besseyi]